MIKTYDAKKVIVSIGGIVLSGFADGAFVTVERDAETFTKQVGADGEVVRSRMRNTSGKVTVNLLQSSASNDLLSALWQIDEATGAGAGAFLMKDLLGTTLAEAQNAWVQKPPSVEMGKEAGDREWVFDTDALKLTVGGQIPI